MFKKQTTKSTTTKYIISTRSRDRYAVFFPKLSINDCLDNLVFWTFYITRYYKSVCVKLPLIKLNQQSHVNAFTPWIKNIVRKLINHVETL